MNTETIIALVVGIGGALGIKQIWGIVSEKLSFNNSANQSATEYKRKRIDDLEGKLDAANKKIAELMVTNARQEERLLMNAKNRVKK